MVGTSKILTVSYGTFSCTLEGFDDSFNTMKAIAEYFRGLAADDRYFGAEPPTPDTEMLAKIAEREISRRVDAHMDDDGEIVLRAAALTDQSRADDPEESKHDGESRAQVEAARKAAKARRKVEKAAQKAARKAAKAEEKAARKAADKEAAEQAEAETEAESAPDDRDETSFLKSVSAATADVTEGATGPEVEEMRGDASPSVLAASDPAPDLSDADAASVPANPAGDSVSAKLQRIRAVVGKREDGHADDLSEQFLPQADAQDVADIGANDSTAPPDLTTVGDAPGEAPDMISRVMERPADDAPVTDDRSDAPRARVVRMKRVDFDQAVADGTLPKAAPAPAPIQSPAVPDLGLLDGADDLDDYFEDSDFTDTDLESDLDIDADLAEDLRAIHDERDDDQAVAAQDDDVEAVEIDEPDAAEDTVEAGGEADDADFDDAETGDDSVLSGVMSSMMSNQTADQTGTEVETDMDLEAEEDADTDADPEEMVDEQADVETEAGDQMHVKAATDHEVEAETDTDVQHEPDTEAQSDPATTAFKADEPQVDDAALDRLMSETDAQMKEPEGSRRRDAIAQLKAAVAAKEAARAAGETDDDDQDVENAFRNDLSEVVRPEGAVRPRPVLRDQTRTERPRPAPLKLVAAQRVDLPEGERRDGPVVPRRVAARRDDTAQQASGSFAEFAENMGATELPDLLEAAAAYTSFVEGADEFSRPQILRRVRAVASDDFNREDGLRSFADLLKKGRFTKVRNGRFQVADDSRFNPEQRAS